MRQSLEERNLFVENLKLSEIIRSLKAEFADLTIDLKRDATIRADKRALQVVFRNIFQNAIIHGEATTAFVDAQESGQNVHIKVTDNGKGISSQHLPHLGKEPLTNKSSETNGIGLYLTRRLLLSMKGNYLFQAEPTFTNVVILTGTLG